MRTIKTMTNKQLDEIIYSLARLYDYKTGDKIIFKVTLRQYLRRLKKRIIRLITP
jgi:hypothetical protein